MKNKASDLHDILFEQLERLNDLDENEMKGEELRNEIMRSEAINRVSAQLISNGRLGLDVIKLRVEAAGKVKIPDTYRWVDRDAEALPPPSGKSGQ